MARPEGTVTSQTTFPYITQPQAVCQPTQRQVQCVGQLYRPSAEQAGSGGVFLCQI